MYIKITNRCNMNCAHCSANSGPRGKHMSLKTYRKALIFAESRGSIVSLGGGEPTIHPSFWQMFGEAMASDAEGVWLATNGSQTSTAMALARLARNNERFSVTLSQDVFHDPINWKVVEEFRRCGCEIRDVSDKVVNTGRAKKNQLGNSHVKCACDELFVDVDGTIYACGCRKIAFGTVYEPQVPDPSVYEFDEHDSHHLIYPRKQEIAEEQECQSTS